MSRLTIAASFAAALCVTGWCVQPVSAQCAVISVDPACKSAVRPSVRVAFDVTAPDGLSALSPTRSLVDRSSVRVPLLLRQRSHQCRDRDDDGAKAPARHPASQPDSSQAYVLDDSAADRQRTGCLSSHPRAGVVIAPSPSGGHRSRPDGLTH